MDTWFFFLRIIKTKEVFSKVPCAKIQTVSHTAFFKNTAWIKSDDIEIKRRRFPSMQLVSKLSDGPEEVT